MTARTHKDINLVRCRSLPHRVSAIRRRLTALAIRSLIPANIWHRCAHILLEKPPLHTSIMEGDDERTHKRATCLQACCVWNFGIGICGRTAVVGSVGPKSKPDPALREPGWTTRRGGQHIRGG